MANKLIVKCAVLSIFFAFLVEINAKELPGKAVSVSITLPPQPVGEALIELALIYDLDFVLISKDESDRKTDGISGTYTSVEALEALLSSTGLSYRYIAGHTVLVGTLSRLESINYRRLSDKDIAVSGERSRLEETAGETKAADDVDLTEQHTQLEEIVVTGSRLPRSGYGSPIPVTSVTENEVTLSGATNFSDYMSEIPVFGIGINRVTDFGGNPPATIGTNLMDLRTLGSERTLVLVDGRRHVGSIAGSTAVDVGSIPMALVKRVEISTGGASVSYGADAVAGVVNLILARDFEGVELDTRYGDSQHGGGVSKFFSFTAGRNFSNKRGNAVLNITQNSEGAIAGVRRDWINRQSAFVPNPEDMGPNDGIPAQVLADNTRLSQFSTSGNLVGGLTGETVIVSDDGLSVRPYDPGANPGGIFQVGGDGVNVASLQQVSNPVDRLLIQGLLDYRISNNTNVFFDAKYYNVKATNISQPQFDALTHFEDGDPFWVDPGNPFLPQNDPQLSQLIADNNGMILLSRMHTDFGLRIGEVDRDTYRFLAGVSGTFTKMLWNYELVLHYGKSEEHREQRNDRDPRRFRLAADAVVDTFGVTGVPPGSPACRATVEAMLSGGTDDPDILECRPVNIFGSNLATQESISYFSKSLFTERSLDQFSVEGEVYGELWELNDEPVTFALGLAYRRESSESTPDAAQISGDNFLGVSLPVFGSYWVAEGYFETRIPLANSIGLELGTRFSYYDTVGSTLSWRTGLDWKPANGLRLHGMWSEAVRAPNIGELFTPNQQGFVPVSDPCDKDRVLTGPNPDRRLKNCTQDLAKFGLDPLTYDDPFDGFGHPAIIGGNPLLLEETSRSLTYGFTFNPSRFNSHLSISADFYDIEIKNAIATPDSTRIIADCYDKFDTLDNRFCGLFSRNAGSSVLAGSIEDVVISLLNIDALRTNGLDLGIAIDFPPNSLFSGLDIRFLASRVDSYRLFPAGSKENLVESAGTQNIPEWRANLNFIYAHKNMTLSYLLRWIDSVRFSQFVFPDDINPVEKALPFRAKSKTVSDIQLRYNVKWAGWSDQFEVYFGVNNLFDVVPPPGVRQGVGATSSSYYDPIGRFYYGGLRLRF